MSGPLNNRHFTVLVNDEPKPLRPYCQRCGWRKGGPDSWDGNACKCHFTEPPIERVVPNLSGIARELTINAAITMRYSAGPQIGRIFTGNGKWTTLAAIGVENNLKKLGLIELRPLHEDRPDVTIGCWTSLADELRQYITDHWDEIEFRDPPKR